MSLRNVLVLVWGCQFVVACGSQAARPPAGNNDGGGGDASALGLDAPASLDTGVGVDAAVCPAEPAGGPVLSTVVSDRAPAAASTGICLDTQLRLTFTTPVSVGTCGKIQVWKASAPATAVDTIDLAATPFQDTIGGRRFLQNRPVFIDGMQAIIYLHRSAPLAPNETYFVTIDSGVFVDANKTPLGGMKGPTDWTFSTRAPTPPLSDSLVVSLDGTGDFCSVQGAVDFIPAANTAPVTINIKNGTYREIVFISRKNNVTLHGEDPMNTVIAYANNNNLQTNAALAAVGGTGNRAMVEVENSNGLVVENITLHNLTPQGNSQAEALRVEPGDQVILRDARFISLQDTLLLSGRAYVTRSYIEGNVDFIWGKGTVYFDNCEIKTVGRVGFNVQSRNPANVYGYVFVDSKLTSDPGLTGHMLARIDGSVYPASHVAYINCQMGSHISPLGWTITPGTITDTSGIRFWEYQSTDMNGAPIDVSLRLAASRQLTDAEAAMMRDKSVVFGLPAWNPTP